MATLQPIMLQSRAARLEVWEPFQRELERQVRECNVLAGETLWHVVRTGDPLRITLERFACPGDRLVCSFDADAGVLACVPGPGVRARPLRFRCADGALVRQGRRSTVSGAVSLVLDELVRTDWA
jgi:hypothetical protein